MRLVGRVVAAALVFAAVVLLPDLILGNGPTGPSSDLGLGRLLASGSLVAFAAAFAGGVLTSLTPCVYPLIPITVSVFGAGRSASGAGRSTSRGRALALSGMYVLGIAATYSTLGAVAALTGRAFGSVMQNPWVMGGVAVVFAALAASMFGAFELALPPGLQARVNKVGGAGLGGALAMGLVAGVVAAPCTGPVLAAALTFVATRGSLLFGVGILFTYALGIGLLFFLIGTFSVALPRSGPWMVTVKAVFGVAMLAAAGIFLAGAFPSVKSLFSASHAAALAAAGASAAGVLLGALSDGGTTPRLPRAARVLGVLLVTGGIVYAVGAAGARGRAAPSLAWIQSEPEGLALARSQGRPVLIDFWADWCTACKELDRIAWSDPRVQAEASRFVAVKLDGTADNAPFQAAFEKYRVAGMPTVILIDAHGRELPERITSAIGADAMLERLRSVERACVGAVACATRW
jgi:thiol:disulfide interchange protein DsbD